MAETGGGGRNWHDEPDRSNEPKREPGPINLQKSVFVPAHAGVPTFQGVPLCLNQADLKAGRADPAIVGGRLDMSVGMRSVAAQFGQESSGHRQACPLQTTPSALAAKMLLSHATPSRLRGSGNAGSNIPI
jgi:hypothetical protein